MPTSTLPTTLLNKSHWSCFGYGPLVVPKKLKRCPIHIERCFTFLSINFWGLYRLFFWNSCCLCGCSPKREMRVLRTLGRSCDLLNLPKVLSLKWLRWRTPLHTLKYLHFDGNSDVCRVNSASSCLVKPQSVGGPGWLHTALPATWRTSTVQMGRGNFPTQLTGA